MFMDSYGHLPCSEGSCHATRVLSVLSDTLSSYVKPAYWPAFLGPCEIGEVSAGFWEIRFSASLLKVSLSMFGVKDKDCLLVERLRVNTVHLSLTLPKGGEVGTCMCLWNSESHPLSAPGDLNSVGPLLLKLLPHCGLPPHLAGEGAEKMLKPLSKGFDSTGKGKQDQHHEM